MLFEQEQVKVSNFQSVMITHVKLNTDNYVDGVRTDSVISAVRVRLAQNDSKQKIILAAEKNN
jgi:hypothetical protein